VKYVIKTIKEMSKMENKKESPLPMIVLLITIGIGVIVLVWFIFLGE